jgi:HlyD family secretion protein
VLEIAPRHGLRFEAVIPGKDVGNLRVGMPVHIKFDAYDYQKYGVLDGTVTYLSPDSKLASAADESSDAKLRNNAAGAPAAYIVRIELAGEEVGRGDLHAHLKLGLGGTAEIVTGRESLLTILVRRIRQSISLG